MKVKICGIMTKQDALFASQMGADFIGFVFAPSKRQITPSIAQEIAAVIPKTTKIVGIFVNESVEQMQSIAHKVKLDFIQLHGNESADIAQQLSTPVIKAFSIDEALITDINHYPCTYVLIDTAGGGTGKTFDWARLDHLHIEPERLFIAGGLTAENVQTVQASLGPFGVDVSSGVETNYQKDHQKIRQFIHASKTTIERMNA